jgi:hypothetical protein
MTRIVAGMIVALALAGCAGQSLTTAATPAGEQAMSGRWMLAAPNAPMCGMNFTGSRSGKVSPEGGCPGNFYLSRSWEVEGETLVIKDDNDNTLARLPGAGGRFEGPSVAGLAVTLTRPSAPPQ